MCSIAQGLSLSLSCMSAPGLRLQADLDEAESRLEAVQGHSHGSSADGPTDDAHQGMQEHYQAS